MFHSKASTDLRNRLANFPSQEFEPKLSMTHSQSFSESNFYDFYREMVNIEVVHTPISALPRYLKMRNTMKMKGLLFDHMEVSVLYLAERCVKS